MFQIIHDLPYIHLNPPVYAIFLYQSTCSEATSALDSESEQTVQKALDKLLSNDSSLGQSRMTTLVVAHRLSTIKNGKLFFTPPQTFLAMLLPDSHFIFFQLT